MNPTDEGRAGRQTQKEARKREVEGEAQIPNVD